MVDSNGDMVPFGTPGELLIRGYVNMIGYFNDAEKTKETIDSTNWLHTGYTIANSIFLLLTIVCNSYVFFRIIYRDQFVLYEDGYGNIVGRIKEMIIRGGENLFPVEIEYFLESHPLIVLAQVSAYRLRTLIHVFF